MLSRRKLEKLMDGINYLILTLNDKEMSLRHAIRKMREEERYYMGLCKEAFLRKEKLKAEAYICHIASIRWAIRLFEKLEARVIGLKIRLITCQRIARVWMSIRPDIEGIKKEAGPLLNSLPWLKPSIENLCYEIDAFLKATQFETIEVPENPLAGKDIPTEILKEVMEEVKRGIEEMLPSPPKEQAPEATGEEGLLLVSIEDGPPSPPMSIEELAHNLMDYIRQNGRRLNVRKCAEELGVSEEDIRAALKWLCDKGMIKIRGAGYGVREGS